MEILYLLVPVSVVLVLLIGYLFWWSIDHGQFANSSVVFTPKF